jgi:hypothetical protein
LTAQVIGELFRATTKGPAYLLTPDQALQQVDNFIATWPVLDTTMVAESSRAIFTQQFGAVERAGGQPVSAVVERGQQFALILLARFSTEHLKQ